MKLDAHDIPDLQPLITEIVRATIAELQATDERLADDRLAYSEAEAARLLGVPRNVLRDQRLKFGRIKASKIGREVVYERAELLRFLASRQINK